MSDLKAKYRVSHRSVASRNLPLKIDHHQNVYFSLHNVVTIDLNTLLGSRHPLEKNLRQSPFRRTPTCPRPPITIAPQPRMTRPRAGLSHDPIGRSQKEPDPVKREGGWAAITIAFPAMNCCDTVALWGQLLRCFRARRATFPFHTQMPPAPLPPITPSSDRHS
jgi:hypothetical protein